MREESEIIAMRDKLERVALSYRGIGHGRPVLTALRWALDPRFSDREILDYVGGEDGSESGLPRALEVLTGPDPDWHLVDEYVGELPSEARAALAAVARKIARRCVAADKAL